MAEVIFYEKPGCVNNTRQKRLLSAAGHRVLARSLLTERWEPGELRRFFGDLPVAAWFNRTAPAIKERIVDPEAVDERQALALMRLDPLLIRRPLMRVGDEFRVGFEPDEVDAWIGLGGADLAQDVETCTQRSGHACEVRLG